MKTKEVEAKTSEFISFSTYRIEKSEINISNDYNPETDNQIELEIKTGHTRNSDNNIILKMEVVARSNTKKLEIKVVSTAVFKVGSALKEEMLEKFVTSNASAILFPHIRAFITNLTALSMIPPVILPTLNFSTPKTEKKVSKKKKKESD